MIALRHVLLSSAARVGFSVLYSAQAFFMMPFLVKNLGEHTYGIWVVVAGVVATSYLLDLGLTSAVMRFMAKSLGENDDTAANEVINTCLVIYTALGTVIGIGAVGLALAAPYFVSDQTALGSVRLVFLLLGMTYATEFPFKAFSGVISTYMRYDLLMVSRLASVTFTNIAFVYLLTHGYGIVAMAATTFVLSQVAAFVFYRIARNLFTGMRLGRQYVRRDLVPQLFSYSLWSFAIQIANTVRFGVDSFVIASVRSAASVTYYAVALRLVEVFADLINKATNMMMPVFAVDFFQNNLGELRRKYFLVVRVTAVAALYGGGMIVLLGRMFILRWMGPQFEQSYPVLVVLMLAMVFEVIGNGSDNMLFALNKHRYLAFASVGEAAVNFVLSVLLIGPYGLVGVAVGTAVPLVLSRAVVIPRLTMQALQLPLWNYYRNLAPAVLFAGAFVGATAWVTAGHLAPPSYLTIVLIAAIASPIYVLGAFYVVFDATERAFVAGVLPPWMARRLPGIAAA